MGRPTSPHLPFDRRGPGPFHTRLHHVTVLFKLFAAAAQACNCLPLFCEQLVKLGLNNIATEAMKKCPTAGRRASPEDAFSGPDSIVFMFFVPTLVKKVFLKTSNSPPESRCVSRLLVIHRDMRSFHKLMLSLDWHKPDSLTGAAGPGDDGLRLLRAAGRRLHYSLLGATKAAIHPRLDPDGKKLFNAACHNIWHVCDCADKLWARHRIPIGRCTEHRGGVWLSVRHWWRSPPPLTP
jgi:hypothetical protein